MRRRCPVVIDPSRSDIHTEGASIRVGGPVAPIGLPGGARAWSATGQAAARPVLSDQRFSKVAGWHWVDIREGRTGEDFMNGLGTLPVPPKGEL